MPVRHTKQVRFAYKNVFHSPPVTPIMPGLSFSTSTTPSSVGAITPPSTTYPLPATPQRAAYGLSKPMSASGYAGSARPHPYFETAAITWDLMDHPTTISRHHQSVSSRVWSEPATSPPMPFLVITVSGFAWKFNVYASNHAYVTFEDVVDTIYRSLRKNITQSEFHSAAPTPAEQRRASRAYEQRYRRQRSTHAYEEEKRGGMKRVDFLMGHTKFDGLTPTGRRSDEWRLSVT